MDDDIMTGQGVTLLDRLDFLRGFLLEERKHCVFRRDVPWQKQRFDGELDVLAHAAEIDAHLATLDDACEALQA